MKRFISCLTIAALMLLSVIAAYAAPVSVTGIINEVYITDGMGDKVQCLLLTLDTPQEFNVGGSNIYAEQVQIAAKNYTPEMDGTHIECTSSDIMEGVGFYHIRPVVMLGCTITPIAEASNEIKVIVNGEELSFDQPPVMKDDRVFVPVRAIAEKLGARVDWEEYGAVTISNENSVLNLYTNDIRFYQNNINYISDAAAFIENGRTLVPVRLVSQALNCEVEWDEDSQTVTVSSIVPINEEMYASLKADGSKPLVYTAYETEFVSKDGNNLTCSYNMPALNIKGGSAAELNQKISAVLMPKINSELDNDYSPNYINISYSYSIYNDVLSVLVHITQDYGCDENYCFNYDLRSNTALSNNDIAALCGTDIKENVKLIQAKCAYAFQLMNKPNLDNGLFTLDFYNEQIGKASSDYCYSENSELFVSASGQVFAVTDFPSVAGGSSYETMIDTGMKVSR